MKQPSEQEVLHRAAAYCSTTERCIQDVLKKIESFSLSKEENSRIISRLCQEKFIDETRFARSFANDKLRFNKWGRIKIDYELRKKGIPSSVRDEAIGNIDESTYSGILHNLLRSKLKTIREKDTQDTYYKLLRFAAGRGFTASETNLALKLILKDTYDPME